MPYESNFHNIIADKMYTVVLFLGKLWPVKCNLDTVC